MHFHYIQQKQFYEMTELSNIIFENKLLKLQEGTSLMHSPINHRLYIDNKVKQYQCKYDTNTNKIQEGSDTDITGTRTPKTSKKSIYERRKRQSSDSGEPVRSGTKKIFYSCKNIFDDSYTHTSNSNANVSENLNREVQLIRKNQMKLERRMKEEFSGLAQKISKLQYNEFMMMIEMSTVKKQLKDGSEQIKKIIKLLQRKKTQGFPLQNTIPTTLGRIPSKKKYHLYSNKKVENKNHKKIS